MAIYRVVFSFRAERQFSKLARNVQLRICHVIEKLKITPRSENVKKLQGVESLYRLRIGDYRLLYSVEDNVLTVLVISVGHRKDIYKKNNL